MRKATTAKEVYQEEKLEIELDEFPMPVGTSSFKPVRDDDTVVPSSFRPGRAETITEGN